MNPCVFWVLLRNLERVSGEGVSLGVLLISVVLEIPNENYCNLGENTWKALVVQQNMQSVQDLIRGKKVLRNCYKCYGLKFIYYNNSNRIAKEKMKKVSISEILLV